jgi:hypothetical protein
MADDEVRQEFVADAEGYIRPLDEMAEAAGHFRDEAVEAGGAADDLGGNMVQMAAMVEEAKARLDGADEAITAMGIDSEAAGEGVGHLRDEMAEAAGAAKGLKDELHGVRDAEAEAAGAGGGEGIASALASLGGADAGFLAAGAALAPVIAAILSEVVALASGFAAAGAGVGAFVALAIPAFDQVKNAYTGIGAAQKAYHTALETEKLSPSKTHAAAVASSLVKLKEAWQGLDPAERGAVRGLQDLSGEYHKMAKAFEPDAFRVFNQGLRLANELLPDLKPFADTAATAIGGLLRDAAKFADSSGFKDWLAQFQKLEGPSITAIGKGIGLVGVAIGKLLTEFSAKDDVHAINILFSALSGTVSALGWVAARAAHQWDAWSNVIDDFRKVIVAAGHDAETVFDDFRHANAQLAGDARRDWADIENTVSNAVDVVRETVIRWGHDVEHDWDTAWSAVVSYAKGVPGKIESAFGDLPGLLVHLGAELIDGLIHGIEGAIPGLSFVIGHVEGLLGDLSGAASAVGNAVAGAGSVAVHAFGPSPHAGTIQQVVIHQHIAGSVLAQQDLGRAARNAFNDHTMINATAGLSLPGRNRTL